MSKRPTLRTVAEEAKVSLPTVSQVMRGVGRISDSTRKRVLEAANRVGYVPDESAIAVRTGRSNEIGIILHFIANHFNSELIGGVSSVLEPAGFSLSVQDAQDDDERVEQLVRTVLSRRPAGMLWVPGESLDPTLVPLILKQNVPSITFLRDTGITELSNISINNEEATHKATEHLIALGHKKLAYIGGMPRSQTRAKRLRGFHRAIAEAGLPAPFVLDCHESKTTGFEIMFDFIKANPDITGLVFYGDELAIGACLALQRMGKEAGREVSIIGFDDIEEAALLTPTLTTLSINPFNFGQRLAQLLIDKVNGGSTQPEQIIIDATLNIRGTSGAPDLR